MSMFKGSAYAGQMKTGTGGFAKQSSQPKPAFGGSPSTYAGNKGASATNMKNSMFGKKWKSTCSGCGGKM